MNNNKKHLHIWGFKGNLTLKVVCDRNSDEVLRYADLSLSDPKILVCHNSFSPKANISSRPQDSRTQNLVEIRQFASKFWQNIREVAPRSQ